MKQFNQFMLFSAVVMGSALTASAQLPPPVPPADLPLAEGSIGISNFGTLVSGVNRTITTIVDSSVSIDDGYGDDNDIYRSVNLFKIGPKNTKLLMNPINPPAPYLLEDDPQDDNTVDEPYTDTFVATYANLASGTYMLRANLGIRAGGVGGLTLMDDVTTTFIIP